MKNKISQVKALLFIVVFLFSAFLVQSQTKITGVIKDDKGGFLQGVSIVEKGTNHNSRSGDNGSFSIAVTSPKSVLVFSYVGMATMELAVGNRTFLNVELDNAIKTSDEVVVVGYGTQKKPTVVGAISTVKGSDLVRSGLPSVANALTGLVPGMVTVQASGLPGPMMQEFIFVDYLLSLAITNHWF